MEINRRPSKVLYKAEKKFVKTEIKISFTLLIFYNFFNILFNYFNNKKINNNKHIMLIPGYTCSDNHMIYLKIFLLLNGYKCITWNQGRNNQFNFVTLNKLERFIKNYCKVNNTNLFIISHQLGGIYGKVISYRNPQLIQHLITLGSPLFGDLKRNVNYFELYERQNGKIPKSLWHLYENLVLPDELNITTINQYTDGIVNYNICILKNFPNYFIECQHYGLIFNHRVFERLVKII